MNKLTKISALLVGASATLMANAASFNVQVEINNILGNTPLAINETRAVSFPVINVDEATSENTICVANGHSGVNKYINGSNTNSGFHTSATSLCPGVTVPGSLVRISGTPNASISVALATTAQTQGGFEFTGSNGTSNRVLNGSGNYDTGIAATLKLLDKASVTSGLLTFNYDVTAAYQ